MRFIALTAAASLAALPALASSIETITAPRLGNNSMMTITCADCPPVPPKTERAGGYKAPQLDGVQKEEISEHDGKRMLVRTDRWMGGSPNVFYQALTPVIEAAMAPRPVIDPETMPATAGVMPPDGIDTSATTSAVTAEPEKDFSGFALRLR